MPKRLIDANALYNDLKESVKAAREWKEEAQDEEIKIRAEQAHGTFCECALRVKNAPTIDAEPVRHGYWIECDYKTLEHGEIESAYKAGLCCSECRTGFKKNHMTYKAFCPACGAKMDENGSMFTDAFSQCDGCPDWNGTKCKSDCHGCEDGGADNEIR